MTEEMLVQGKSYRLAPSFDDLSQIENLLSTSLLALAKKLAEGWISLQELMVIIENSIEPEARKLDLKEAVLLSGITHSTQMVTALFMHLFRGLQKNEGITREELAGMMEL